MRFLLLITAALLLAGAAEAKTKPAKRKAADLTASELHSAAMAELRSVPSPNGAPVKPMAESTDMALVSTAEALREDEREPLAASELEIGAQSYRPIGTGQVAEGESYSFAGLSSKPMFLAGGRHWFYQGLRTSFPVRVGAGLGLGFSRNVMRIQTSRGYIYDDVRLQSFLALAGPEAEYFLDGKRRFALGLRAAAGQLVSSQSATNTTITRSRDAGIWEGSAHLRFQATTGLFLKLAFAKRDTFGATEGLGIQQNNYEALVGFGI